jgi:hypothetical protein
MRSNNARIKGAVRGALPGYVTLTIYQVERIAPHSWWDALLLVPFSEHWLMPPFPLAPKAGASCHLTTT